MINTIENIKAERVLDSRGNPTLKVTVYSTGEEASFSVPSGASTGTHEAHELRDEDGKGVDGAIEKIHTLVLGALKGQDIFDQRNIDNILINLDGTKNKENLGGNSMLGVSIACAKLAAKLKGIQTFEYLRTLARVMPSRQTPYLYMNLINGGKHAHNGLAFQEYLVVPDTTNPKEAVDMALQIQDSLQNILSVKYGMTDMPYGDEGGIAVKMEDIRFPLMALKEVLVENKLENKVRFALDVAATSFYKNGLYKVNGQELNSDEMHKIYKSLIAEFNLLSVEDPFHEEDFENYRKLKDDNGALLVVGDDLTVTNKDLVQLAIKNGSINAMIIKPNQIGTLSETLDTMKLARDNNIELIVSHRSGETTDDFIADLAFAFGVFGLKAGSPKKEERMAKYRRLIEISN